MTFTAGAVALVLAFLAGTHPVALVAAGLAWTVAAFAPATPRLLALLAAPVALAAGVPWHAGNALTLVGALSALAVLASLVPLERVLGPGRPPARVAAAVAAVAVLPVALAFTPEGAVILASDLATGALVVSAGAGLLVATTVALRARRLEQPQMEREW